MKELTQFKKAPIHQFTGKVKLNSLQFARGIAALLVVLHHGASHLKIFANFTPVQGMFYFGHTGVIFFFVLSGFIIFFVHAKDLGRSEKLGHYLMQRFTRIYPVYWLIIGMYVYVVYIPFPFTLENFLMDLALLPMAKLQTLGVAWTLRHELFFYTLFAVAILSKRLGSYLFALWFLAIILRCFKVIPLLQPEWLNNILATCNLEFMMGIFAAFFCAYYRIRFPKLILFVSVCLFLGYGYVDNKGILDTYQDVVYLPFGLLSMLILICLVELEFEHELKFSRFWITLGEASYSIYLSHLLFLGIAFKYLRELEFMRQNPNIGFGCMVAFALVAGVIVSLLLEVPLIIRTRKMLNYIFKS